MSIRSGSHNLPTKQNPHYQLDLAKRLLDKLGREDAIQSAKQFHWYGVVAALENDV